MNTASLSVLYWSPRVLGVLMCAFLGLFALDAFSADKTIVEALRDFVIHLAPAALLLVIVATSWRREWIGAIAFFALAIGYMFMVRGRLDWILVISGPLLIVGTLFWWSWHLHAKVRRSS